MGKVKEDTIFNFDGTKLRLEAPDLDRDGVTDEVESVQVRTPSDELAIVQQTELGELTKELFKDDLELNNRQSSIDMKANLSGAETTAVLALDALVALRFCPPEALGLTRQKKRLSVSVSARGRNDVVNIVAGKRETEQKALSGLQKIGQFLGGGKNG